nr:RNA-dependent RNA polymerase 6 [Tanacetum cinerariifolium]
MRKDDAKKNGRLFYSDGCAGSRRTRALVDTRREHAKRIVRNGKKETTTLLFCWIAGANTMVKDDIFWDMRIKNVMNLKQMLVDNDVAYDVITTSCAESKNTSSIMLGDIWVLKAVNTSGLEHLVDRLIFPQKGERPHTDEASVSDLDGDLYFVTWDEHLILPSKQSWPPMEYTAAKAKELPCKVRCMTIGHSGMISANNIAMDD